MQLQQQNTLTRYVLKYALPVIILFYLFNGIVYIRHQSITSDEHSFYNYAVRYLKGNPQRVEPRTDNSKMPVSVFNTIPRIVEQFFNKRLLKYDNGTSDILNGRYVTLAFSVLTILLCYVWAKQLYGEAAGILAAFFMSICPNNLANAGFVTTDSYSSFFLLATLYSCWQFCKHPSFKKWCYLSIIIALSQLVKQSLFHLYVVVPCLLLVYYIVYKPVMPVKKTIYFFVTFIFINWLIINAGYYFTGSNTPLGEYKFMSNLFKQVQQYFPSNLIVPLPKPFVDGLDMAKYYDQIGGGIAGVSSFGKVTILQNEATGKGIWYYYFISLLFKTPLSFIVLLFAAITLLCRNSTLKQFVQNEFFLLIPIVYFLFIFSFLYKTQTGIRHLIFIYPLWFVCIAASINHLKYSFQRFAFWGLILLLLINVGKYWANYYPYTNELIVNKTTAYQYVGSANLEFLQGGFYFNDFLQNNPNINKAPLQPSVGRFLINTEDYLDVWNTGKYKWLSKIQPYSHVAYNGLLIQVTEADVKYLSQ